MIEAIGHTNGNSIIIAQDGDLFYMFHGDVTYTDEALYENKLSINSGLKVRQTGSKVIISWGKVKDVDKYVVYGEYCGNSDWEKLKTITKKGMTKVEIKKLHGKKLNLKKNYKFYVAAYKKVGGKYKRLCKTVTAHIIGRKNLKNTNVKNIKLQQSSVSLNAGETYEIKATPILVDPEKKMLSDRHAPTFRYASSNKKVAKVDKDGKVTAKKGGSCIIYVYAKNGYAEKVKVKVK